MKKLISSIALALVAFAAANAGAAPASARTRAIEKLTEIFVHARSAYLL